LLERILTLSISKVVVSIKAKSLIAGRALALY